MGLRIGNHVNNVCIYLSKVKTYNNRANQQLYIRIKSIKVNQEAEFQELSHRIVEMVSLV